MIDRKHSNNGSAWFLFVPLFLLTAWLLLTGRSTPTAETAPVSQPLSTDAETPLQVGEHLDADITLSYADPDSLQQTIHYPEAAFIKVRFDQVDLRPGDLLIVRSPDGRQRHAYPGAGSTSDDAPGFWALTIVGEAVVIELVEGIAPETVSGSAAYDKGRGGAGATELGAHINRYARGFTDYEIERQLGLDRSTCGDTNERTDVACFEESHPTEFDNATAAVRILRNGASHCTGWRVTPDNFLLTNEHCISSQAELNQMEFWFEYQRPGCQEGPALPAAIVTGNSFLIDNFTLDFALVTLDNFNTIESFGYFELDVRTPVLDEEIYIAQHGAGNPKEFGITSDMNLPDNLCHIDDAIRNGYGTDTDTGYYCDTIGGSSGSPVLARDTHMAIAIHHFGVNGECNEVNMNAGVRIDLIYPLIDVYLPDRWLGPDGTHLIGTPTVVTTHTFTLVNGGLVPATYNLGLSGAVWPTSLATNGTVVVPAGGRTTIMVEVTAGSKGSDSFLLTATPVTEGEPVLTSTGRTSVDTTYLDFLPTIQRP